MSKDGVKLEDAARSERKLERDEENLPQQATNYESSGLLW